MGIYAPAVGDVAVGKTREAVVPHDADPSVYASELPDHAHWDMGAAVDGVVLADRIHAVDGRTVISVEAPSGKVPTALFLLLISRLMSSIPLFVLIRRQCSGGNSV